MLDHLDAIHQINCDMILCSFVPYWQRHVELILNVNWLHCHICRQLYCQPWDEQRYLSYRHLLVSLLTPIGGEALSHCDFLALYCRCMQLRTIGFRIPAPIVILCKLSIFWAFYLRPIQDMAVIKTIKLLIKRANILTQVQMQCVCSNNLYLRSSVDVKHTYTTKYFYFTLFAVRIVIYTRGL